MIEKEVVNPEAARSSSAEEAVKPNFLYARPVEVLTIRKVMSPFIAIFVTYIERL